jgi:hypothetical protein
LHEMLDNKNNRDNWSIPGWLFLVEVVSLCWDFILQFRKLDWIETPTFIRRVWILEKWEHQQFSCERRILIKSTFIGLSEYCEMRYGLLFSHSRKVWWNALKVLRQMPIASIQWYQEEMKEIMGEDVYQSFDHSIGHFNMNEI